MPRLPARPALAAVALTALGGAVAGWSGARGNAMEWSEGAPPGWRREARPAPYMNDATLGALAPSPSAWALSAYAALVGPKAAENGVATVRLGDEGQLWLFPAAEGGREPLGDALALETGVPPAWVRVVAGQRPVTRACAGSLPTPGPDGYTVSWARTSGGWSFSAADGTIACPGASNGPPALASGLRRVHVPSLATGGSPAPIPADRAPTLGMTLGGALLGALVAWIELATGAGAFTVALTTLPLFVAPLLGRLDLAGLHDALRVPTMRVYMVPMVVALGVAIAGKLVAACARLGGRGGAHTAAALGLLGAAGAASALAAGGGGGAATWCGAAGLALGGLVQAVVHAGELRFYNLVALSCASALLVSLEFAIRNTAVGELWDATNPVHGAGDINTLIAQLEALHRSEHSDWPASGYPVQAPPKSRPVRVVCLGGSSTAGAYQNSNLDEFYPALLAARLPPDVEVVNQGAGGWNTLHIALYAKSNLASLAPDIVTVYSGVNEVVRVPVTYKELLAAWKAGELRGGPGFLASVRLFQGLRSVVRSVRPAVVAVPPEDTRENLETVIAAARAAHARVLLVSEAVQPRPEAFDAYWKVMRDLVADDVGFLDTAEALRPLGPSAFLDANHLAPSGHAKVAELLAAELETRGWLAEPVSSAGGSPPTSPPPAPP